MSQEGTGNKCCTGTTAVLETSNPRWGTRGQPALRAGPSPNSCRLLLWIHTPIRKHCRATKKHSAGNPRPVRAAASDTPVPHVPHFPGPAAGGRRSARRSSPLPQDVRPRLSAPPYRGMTASYRSASARRRRRSVQLNPGPVTSSAAEPELPAIPPAAPGPRRSFGAPGPLRARSPGCHRAAGPGRARSPGRFRSGRAERPGRFPPPPVAPGGTEKARCGRQGRAPLPLPPHLLQGGHQQPPPLGRVLLAEELVEQRLRLHGAAGPGPLGAAGRAGRAGLGAEEGRGGRAGRPSPGGPAAPRRRRQARSGGGRRRLPHSPPGSRWSPRGAAEVWGRRERGHAARRAGREGRGRAPGARAPPPPRSPSSPSSPARLAAAEHARRRPAPRLRGSSGAVAAAAASCTAEVTSRRRSAPAPLWGCPWAVRERVGCSAVGIRIAVRRCGRERTP